MTTPEPQCSTGLLAHNMNTVDTVLHAQSRRNVMFLWSKQELHLWFISVPMRKVTLKQILSPGKSLKIDINVSFPVIFFEIIIKSSVVILEMRPQDVHIQRRTPPRTRAGAKTVCNRRRKCVWKFTCYIKTYLQFQEDKYYPGKLWINMQLKFHLWTEIPLLQVETANTW